MKWNSHPLLSNTMTTTKTNSSTTFRTILPHEPLPPSSAIHLQGAFVPKSPRPANDDPTAVTPSNHHGCHCSSPSHIEHALSHRLTQLLSCLGLHNASHELHVQALPVGEDMSKVRITLKHSFPTRQLVDRLKRRDISPATLLSCQSCSTCGAKYSGRMVQVTHVSSCGIESSGQERWERAAPPKFQRIVNGDHEGMMEERRGETRFVYVENVGGWSVGVVDSGGENDGSNNMNAVSSVMDRMKECLVSILDGDGAPLQNLHSSVAMKFDGKGGNIQLTAADIQDDLRQCIQDGLRQSLSCFDSSDLGVELFMKSDTSQKKKKSQSMSQNGVYNHFHVGMRSHDDAARLVTDWQGKSVDVTCQLPATFVSLFLNHVISDDAAHPNVLPTVTITITINKLFLDYADVLLPKRIRNQPSSSDPTQLNSSRGLPSRSECTSTTSHIHIPGLYLIPNYVSEEEEQVMMAVLTGPTAPWAPAQYTPSGGKIKRRVQHYGYVFDYESADVLRRNGVKSYEVECCPPLPAVDMKGESDQYHDDYLEEWIAKKVCDRMGWEVLAGVIERTRRKDFVTSFGSHECIEDEIECLSLRGADKNGKANDDKVGKSIEATARNHKTAKPQPLQHTSSKRGTYSDINQLTINEYVPGQGIGSHVDTETAFADGLLIVNLNSGIVMEFRNVKEGTRKLVYLPSRSLILLSEDARYKWEHMIVSRTTDTVDGEVIPRKLRVSLTLRTALTAPAEGKQATPLQPFESSIFPPYWGQPSDADSTDHNDTPSTINRSDLITPSTESKHVHAVYNAIATQWHHTRGKRGVLWPGATQFLENLPPGSVVADVGCGDGKYFSAILGADSYVIGTDISEALLRTASSAEKNGGRESGKKTVEGPQYQQLSDDKNSLSLNPAVAVADCIHLPIRTDSCDAAICIAVMHHLSTKGRRIRCLEELARVVKVGGLINVQAWALEQEEDSKRKFHGADVLVPFNAQPKYLQATDSKKETSAINNNRATNGKGVAQMLSESFDGADFDSKKNLVIFQRYCHMYRRGELEELVAEIPNLKLVESAYEKGNHVVLLRVCN